MSFPPQHRAKLHSTNLIERLIGEMMSEDSEHMLNIKIIGYPLRYLRHVPSERVARLAIETS